MQFENFQNHVAFWKTLFQNNQGIMKNCRSMYARVHQCMPVYAHDSRVCQCTPVYAHVCPSIPMYTSGCPCMPIYARVCSYTPVYDHVCHYMSVFISVWSYMFVYAHVSLCMTMYDHVCQRTAVILGEVFWSSSQNGRRGCPTKLLCNYPSNLSEDKSRCKITPRRAFRKPFSSSSFITKFKFNKLTKYTARIQRS